MAGNSIGLIFRVTSFGESHGSAIGGVIDGVPPGIPINENDIQYELNRRKPGNSRYTSQRKELDQIKILSGIFNGITTGTSIGLIIENTNQNSKDYDNVKDVYRPGHADYTYKKKYGYRDFRGGGRSSARETAIRTAAGAIAKKYLSNRYNIKIYGFLSQIGDIICKFKDKGQIEKNSFFCPDVDCLNQLNSLMCDLIETGDSIGAKITVIAENLPAGLGEPVFDRLDADLAHALMSINAVKGIEVGDGFSVISKKGSEHRDEMISKGFLSNHSGGILGGISNGQPIIVNLALKPTSSIGILGKTIDIRGREKIINIKGRHDPCVGIRAVPVAEAMVAIVLMDHMLRQRAQCLDIIKKENDSFF